MCRNFCRVTQLVLIYMRTEVQWGHWRHSRYTPPCWRYASCEKNGAKMQKSDILRPMLFTDCVFRLAYNSTHNS